MNARVTLAERWQLLAAAQSATRACRAHDLLLLHDGVCLPDAPDWARAALARLPVVVVRRASVGPQQVAVGIRGRGRSERYGTVLPRAAVQALLSPEQLLAADVSGRVVALAVLVRLRWLLADAGLVWGPTGSCGFELACGVPTATASSDLDLLIRCPMPLPLAQARKLHERLGALAAGRCRIDVQLETPAGAVALAEYAQGAQMLLRSQHGARLVADPWDVCALTEPV